MRFGGGSPLDLIPNEMHYRAQTRLARQAAAKPSRAASCSCSRCFYSERAASCRRRVRALHDFVPHYMPPYGISTEKQLFKDGSSKAQLSIFRPLASGFFSMPLSWIASSRPGLASTSTFRGFLHCVFPPGGIRPPLSTVSSLSSRPNASSLECLILRAFCLFRI